jgi:hypothetical protein
MVVLLILLCNSRSWECFSNTKEACENSPKLDLIRAGVGGTRRLARALVAVFVALRRVEGVNTLSVTAASKNSCRVHRFDFLKKRNHRLFSLPSHTQHNYL